MDDLTAQLQPYLHADEQVLWSGRPDPDVRFAPADVFMVPFGLLWGVFTLVFEVSLITNHAPLFFTLSGVPLVAVGLYVMVGRFLVKRHRKLRTAYAVTNQRALIAVGTDSLQEAPIKHIPRAVRRHRDGRHASVSLGNQGLFKAASFYGNTGLDLQHAYGGPLTFYDVSDSEALVQVIDEARAPAET